MGVNASADFWMNLQLRWDLYFAQQAEVKALDLKRDCETVSFLFSRSSCGESYHKEKGAWILNLQILSPEYYPH